MTNCSSIFSTYKNCNGTNPNNSKENGEEMSFSFSHHPFTLMGPFGACSERWPVGSTAPSGAHFGVWVHYPLPRPGLREPDPPPPSGSTHTPFSFVARGAQLRAALGGRFPPAAGGFGGLARDSRNFLPPFTAAKSMAYKADRRRPLSSSPLALHLCTLVRHQLGFRGGVQ